MSPPERKIQSPSKIHSFPIHHGHAIKLGSIISDAAKELVEKYILLSQSGILNHIIIIIFV